MRLRILITLLTGMLLVGVYPAHIHAASLDLNSSLLITSDITYSSMKIQSSGALVFKNNVTITAEGDANIAGKLMSYISHGSDGRTGTAGTNGSNGTRNNWVGGDGTNGGSGGDAGDGSMAYNLTLIVKGALNLTGAIEAKGGNGGDGGNGGRGGNGGAGYTGTVASRNDDDLEPNAVGDDLLGILSTYCDPDGGDGGNGGTGGDAGTGGNGGTITIKAKKVIINTSGIIESARGTAGSAGDGGSEGDGGAGGTVTEPVPGSTSIIHEGQDGSDGWTGGSGRTASGGSTGGIQLITPYLSVPVGYSVSHLNILTDDKPPVITPVLSGFENGKQVSPDVSLEITVQDIGISGMEDTFTASGVNSVTLLVKKGATEVLRKTESITYAASESYSAQKTLQFDLAGLGDGQYTYEVKATHNNPYRSAEGTVTGNFSIDKTAPQPTNTFAVVGDKTGDNLNISWTSFYDGGENGVYYDCLVQKYEGDQWHTVYDNTSVTQSSILVAYGYDTLYNVQISARDQLGNTSGIYTEQFVTQAQTPVIARFVLSGTASAGYLGRLEVNELVASGLEVNGRDVDDLHSSIQPTSVTFEGGKWIYLFTGLEEHAMYEVIVTSYNQDDRAGGTATISDFVPNNSPVIPESTTFVPLGAVNTTSDTLFSVTPFVDPDEDAISYQLILEVQENQGYVSAGEYSLVKANSGCFEKRIDLIQDRLYRWKVVATDQWDGGRGVAISTGWKDLYVDAQAPEVWFTAPRYIREDTFNLTGIAYSADVVSIQMNWENDQDTSLGKVRDLLGKSTDSFTIGTVEKDYQCAITATDQAGNVTTRNFNVCYDHTSPNAVIVSQKKSLVEKNRITLVWSTTDSGPAGLSHYALAQWSNGGWEMLDPSLLTGTYAWNNLDPNERLMVKVQAFDKALNVSETTYAISTLPEYTGCAVEYMLNPDGQINATFTVDAFAEEYQLDKIEYLADGSYHVIAGTRRSPGESTVHWVQSHENYQVDITLYNADGRSVTERVAFAVPNIPPTAPVNTMAGFVNTVTPALDFVEAVDPDGETALQYLFTIRRGDGSVVVADVPYAQVPELQEGVQYYYTVAASDGEAITYSAETGFVIDLQAPAIEVREDLLDYDHVSWVQAVSCSITAADQAFAETWQNSGVDALAYAWTANPVSLNWQAGARMEGIPVPAGDCTLYVWARDFAGNVTVEPVMVEYYVDDAAPEISGLIFPGVPALQGQKYTTNPAQVQVQFGLQDAHSGVKKVAYALVTALECAQLAAVPAERWSTRAVADAGFMRYTEMMAATLPEGMTYYLAVRAKDGVGREAWAVSAESLILDHTPPVIGESVIAGATLYAGQYYVSNLSALHFAPTVSDSGVGVKDVIYSLHRSLTGSALSSATAVRNLDYTEINPGDLFYIQLSTTDWLNNPAGEWFGPFFYALGAPQITQVKLGSYPDFVAGYKQSDPSQLALRWQVQTEVPLTVVKIAIGKTAGGTEVSRTLAAADVAGWLVQEPVTGLQTLTLTDLNLADGNYYLTVYASDLLGQEQQVASAALTIEAGAFQEPLIVASPALAATTALPWIIRHVEYAAISAYYYQILNTAGVEVLSGVCEPVRTPEDTLVNADLTATPLVEGETYYISVYAEKADGTRSATGYSAGTIVDLTAPVIVDYAVDAYFSGATFTLAYSVADALTWVDPADVAIMVGSAPGASDISGGWVVTHSLSGYTLAADGLTDGQKYFFKLRAVDAALNEQVVSGNFTYDNTTPPVPVVRDLLTYSRPTTTLTVDWQETGLDPHSGLEHFDYVLQTTTRIPDESEWVRIDPVDLTPVDPDGDGVVDGVLNRMTIQLNTPLEHGQTYYIGIRAVNKAKLTSVGFSDGVTIDNTAPLQLTVEDSRDFLTTLTDTVQATFAAVEEESKIDHYDYTVGVPGDEDKYLASTSTVANTGSVQASFAEGEWIYFHVTATNVLGLESQAGLSDGILVDTGDPEMLAVLSENEPVSAADVLTFYWQASPSGAPIVGYEYKLTEGAVDGEGVWRTTGENRVVLSGEFKDRVPYYLTVRARDAKGFISPAMSSQGIILDRIAPVTPTIHLPKAYSSPALYLSWSRGAEDVVGEYRYAIGSTLDGAELTGGWVSLDSSTPGWEQIRDQVTVTLDLRELAPALQHDNVYFLKVQAFNRAGVASAIARTQFRMDYTVPETPVVSYQEVAGDAEYPGTLYTTDAWRIRDLQVAAADPETGVVRYRYAIVGAKGEAIPEDTLWSAVAGGDFSFTAESAAELTDGGEYYVAVEVENLVGMRSLAGFSPAIRVDVTEPEIGWTEEIAALVEVVTNKEARAINWTASEAGTAYLTLTKLQANGEVPVESLELPVLVEETDVQTYSFAQSEFATYKLSIVMQDLAGNQSGTIEKLIRVNQPPVVAINSDFALYQGRTAELRIYQLQDPEGLTEEGEYTYVWKLAEQIISTASTASHVFAAKGTYEVTLEVTDADGGMAQAAVTITVTNTLQGELVVDEVWETNLCLDGTVIVPQGRQLTIRPGVQALFSYGNGLVVQGSLVAKGTAGEPVELLSDQVSDCGWAGLAIVGDTLPGQVIELAYVEIYHAMTGVKVMDLTGLAAERLLVEENRIGVHLFAANLTVSCSTFAGNTYYGIKEDEDSETVLVQCNFSANGAAPLYDEVLTLVLEEELCELYGDCSIGGGYYGE